MPPRLVANTSSQSSPPTVNADATLLEKEVAEWLTEESRKRRRASADKENISLTPKGKDTDIEKKTTYQAYGQHIGRLIDFSQIIDHIIETGIKLALDDDENEDENDEDEDKKTKHIAIRHQCEDWDVLCNKIPGFKESMMMLASKRTLRHDVACHLTNGIEAVCCDDCAALKERLPSFILFDPKETLDPPIAMSGNKGDQGFNHKVTGFLLCPITLPTTTETYNKILDGNIIVTAKQLPRFLYPLDHNHDTQTLLDGVFEGYLMVRAAKFILIGCSCATSAPGASTAWRGNAALANITTVTPQIIAYVAVQLHFALSSQSTWGSKDKGHFNYHKFYWNIISFFDADPDAGKEIIGHYNYQLWGDKAGFSGSASQDANGGDDDDDDSDDRFALLRAAKRTRGPPA
ncbi:hypothetical protein BDN71DRAFT_1448326 [Pleurotus eryngii]|uniref:Uncharacterized protein n=1 Tax=Pleurotus eryngii TaxID=5323 RepID=A0A9P6A088_PLEER|nr:hypothetical protein BDN71DRAFT_1448326 [Pleurotus eryngii]